MHVRNIICHVNKGRRMHVNKVYAHVRTSYSVVAVEVVRVGFVLMALAIPVLQLMMLLVMVVIVMLHNIRKR